MVSMKKHTILFSLLGFWLITPHAFAADTRPVIVQQVLDGDTFITTKSEHIRIWGINAPEKDEAGFWQAGLEMDGLIRGKKLLCKTRDTDKYGRTVAQCINSSGDDIAAWLVNQGLARDYTRFSKGFYKKTEQQAKDAKRGLWSKKDGLSPHLKFTP